MSVVYAGGGGGGLSNLLKMALATFGGPVGQASSAIWSAAEGDPMGAITGAMGAAGKNPFGSFFCGKNPAVTPAPLKSWMRGYDPSRYGWVS